MLNIYAPINLLGYGIHASNIIKALMDKNIPINLSKIGQVQVDPYFEPYWKAAEQNLNQFSSKNPTLFIFHDELSHQCSGNPVAVFSVFETTVLKPLSKHMLMNGPADMIFTTTEEHANILKQNGITKPIHVVHEGVDDCIFNTIPTTKYIDTGKFTFITVGKNEKRKNTNEIVKAFIDVIGSQEAALIAHTFNPFLNNQQDHPFKNLACWVNFDPASRGFRYAGWTGKAHKFTNGKADIYFTAPTIQTAEMACLYYSANVGIQCSRAEGWDLPLSEMLACGIPAIATNVLGHSEYLPGLPEHQDLIINPRGSEAAQDGLWFKGDLGEWSIIDQNDIKDKIDQVFKNKDIYSVKSEKISTYMTENYSWSKAADKIKTILNLGYC